MKSNVRRGSDGCIVLTLTPERGAAIAELLAGGASTKETARAIRVHYGTLALWLRRGRAGDEPYRSLLMRQLDRRGVVFPVSSPKPDDVRSGRVRLYRRQLATLAQHPDPDARRSGGSNVARMVSWALTTAWVQSGRGSARPCCWRWPIILQSGLRSRRCRWTEGGASDCSRRCRLAAPQTRPSSWRSSGYATRKAAHESGRVEGRSEGDNGRPARRRASTARWTAVTPRPERVDPQPRQDQQPGARWGPSASTDPGRLRAPSALARPSAPRR